MAHDELTPASSQLRRRAPFGELLQKASTLPPSPGPEISPWERFADHLRSSDIAVNLTHLSPGQASQLARQLGTSLLHPDFDRLFYANVLPSTPLSDLAGVLRQPDPPLQWIAAELYAHGLPLQSFQLEQLSEGSFSPAVTRQILDSHAAEVALLGRINELSLQIPHTPQLSQRESLFQERLTLFDAWNAEPYNQGYPTPDRIELLDPTDRTLLNTYLGHQQYLDSYTTWTAVSILEERSTLPESLHRPITRSVDRLAHLNPSGLAAQARDLDTSSPSFRGDLSQIKERLSTRLAAPPSPADAIRHVAERSSVPVQQYLDAALALAPLDPTARPLEFLGRTKAIASLLENAVSHPALREHPKLRQDLSELRDQYRSYTPDVVVSRIRTDHLRLTEARLAVEATLNGKSLAAPFSESLTAALRTPSVNSWQAVNELLRANGIRHVSLQQQAWLYTELGAKGVPSAAVDGRNLILSRIASHLERLSGPQIKTLLDAGLLAKSVLSANVVQAVFRTKDLARHIPRALSFTER